MVFPPSTLKWFDYLVGRTSSDGTWPKSVWHEPLSALDANVGKFEEFVFEVAVARDDGAILVAEPEGKVRFVHNLRVVKDSGKDHLVIGVSGLGHTPTPVVIDSDAVKGELGPRTRLATKAPSLDDLVRAKSAGEFKSVKAGEDGEVLAERYQEAVGIFWIHPKLWKWMPTTPIPGEDLAWTLLQNFGMDSVKEGEGDDGVIGYAPSEEQKELKNFLTWLWMVANRVVKSSTKEFNGSPTVDQAFFEMGMKLKAPPEGTSASNPVQINTGEAPTVPANDAALRDALRAMATVQEEVLKNQVRDRERKKMTHRYTDENKELFRLLAAKNWQDLDSEVTRFTERLLSDKDPARALEYVQGEVERMELPCVLNTGCLVQFFSQGYVSRDFRVTPSGITLFMCRPKTVPKALPQKEREFLIRSAFGGEDLGDEGVKMFAKTDLYIPKTSDELQKQLETLLGLLKLLNGEENIAIQGYQLGLGQIIKHQTSLAMIEAQENKGMWAKLAFMMDTTFQSFLRNFLDVIAVTPTGESAIEAGREQLQWEMSNDIASIFALVKFGHLPQLHMPAVIMSSQSTRGERTPTSPASNPTGSNESDTPSRRGTLWHAKNPAPVAAWKLPAQWTMVFDFENPRKRPFCMGWPKAAHHRTGDTEYLCIRYQTEGICRKACRLAHKPSNLLTREEKEVIESKIREGVAFYEQERANAANGTSS